MAGRAQGRARAGIDRIAAGPPRLRTCRRCSPRRRRHQRAAHPLRSGLPDLFCEARQGDDHFALRRRQEHARQGHQSREAAPERTGVSRMAGKLTTYDPAEDLSSDKAIATFMAEAFATEDAGYIAHALGVVARAKGMSQIASQTGLSREQLYRSFSENGNPTLKTTIAVMKALGVELTAKVHG